MPNRRHYLAKLASAQAKANRTNDPEAAAAVEAARLNYRRQATEERIAELVATAPPLTAEQADRLAALLRPAATAGRAS